MAKKTTKKIAVKKKAAKKAVKKKAVKPAKSKSVERKRFTNAFEAVGFSEEESVAMKFKAELFREIRKKTEGLTQHEISKLLDIPQPRVSDLLNNFHILSIEKLIQYSAILSPEVHIVLKRIKKSAA
jgi:predicted XRE-type DNA-binding protein